MRRLLLVPAALLLVVLVTGCTGKVTGASNVHQYDAAGRYQADLHATATCKSDEWGWEWFRVRGVDWPAEVPWQYEPAPHAWDCRSGALNPGKAGTYNITHTMKNLAPAETYRVQWGGGCCGDIIDPEPLDPNVGKTPVKGWWTGTGALVGDSNVGNGFNDAFFTTGAVNPAFDPDQAITDSPADTSDWSFGKTSFTCEDTLTACASGVGTGWACGPFPKITKGHFYNKPYGMIGEMWHAYMFGSYCWGTGHYRGKFKNFSIGTNGDPTTVGDGWDWSYDGIESQSGPTVANGKVSWYRTYGFHQCKPPRWSIPGPFHPCIIRDDDNIKIKYTGWTTDKNIALFNVNTTFIADP